MAMMENRELGEDANQPSEASRKVDKVSSIREGKKIDSFLLFTAVWTRVGYS